MTREAAGRFYVDRDGRLWRSWDAATLSDKPQVARIEPYVTLGITLSQAERRFGPLKELS